MRSKRNTNFRKGTTALAWTRLSPNSIPKVPSRRAPGQRVTAQWPLQSVMRHFPKRQRKRNLKRRGQL